MHVSKRRTRKRGCLHLFRMLSAERYARSPSSELSISCRADSRSTFSSLRSSSAGAKGSREWPWLGLGVGFGLA